MKNEYESVKLDKYTMSYYYLTTKIALRDIPKVEDGWQIDPVCLPPSIDMNSVHAYEPGSIIPKIELKLQWKGAGEPEKKAVKIAVEGGSMESFTLFCGEQPPVTPAPTSHPLPQPTPPESGPTSHPLYQSLCVCEVSHTYWGV